MPLFDQHPSWQETRGEELHLAIFNHFLIIDVVIQWTFEVNSKGLIPECGFSITTLPNASDMRNAGTNLRHLQPPPCLYSEDVSLKNAAAANDNVSAGVRRTDCNCPVDSLL